MATWIGLYQISLAKSSNVLTSLTGEASSMSRHGRTTLPETCRGPESVPVCQPIVRQPNRQPSADV